MTRYFLCWLSVAIAALSMQPLATAQDAAAPQPPDRLPNVVIIFMDDMGYNDLSGMGERGYETRNLETLRRQGMRFTNFLVPQAVCGASRAGLLTGCYPNRIGMLGAPGPNARHGINDSEVLIPEMLKAKGYATAMVGKWHLGHHKPFLPTHHGFDEYFGLPYSNDMWPFHPEVPKGYPNLPLIEGDEVLNPIVTPADQENLTAWYTERATQFIEAHAAEPFFLYVAHSMPHVPLYCTERFRGVSTQGRYGDIMMEIDWSVGEILKALDDQKVADNTLVIFTSDNGPWLSYGNHAGSALPLREGKGTEWEGGVRVPCLMRWPGKIPAGSLCHELASTIDLFPTIAKIVDAPLPEHKIDGLDIGPLMRGEKDARTPHETFYYYWGEELQAIRHGDWKLHFPHAYRSLTGAPGLDGRPHGYTQVKTDLALYNLTQDVGETLDVKDEYPQVVEQLQQLAEAARTELGDSAQKRKGAGYRPPAMMADQ
jgi:arylsulfatase A